MISFGKLAFVFLGAVSAPILIGCGKHADSQLRPGQRWIHHGGYSNDNRIGAVLRWGSSGGRPTGVGSGSFLRYQRCLLTAAHVWDGVGPGHSVYFDKFPDRASEYLPILTGMGPHPVNRAAAGTEVEKDLILLWLSEFPCVEGRCRKAPLTNGTFSWDIAKNTVMPTAGDEVIVGGYGYTRSDSNGNGMNDRIRATGKMKTKQASSHVAANTPGGGSLELKSVTESGPLGDRTYFTCEGDSGGPTIFRDTLVGLNSEGTTPCADHITDARAKSTALVNSNAGYIETNLAQDGPAVCRPRIEVGIHTQGPPGANYGYVEVNHPGVVGPDATSLVGSESYQRIISINAPATMTLTAVPRPNYVFGGWTDLSPESCPCTGNSIATSGGPRPDPSCSLNSIAIFDAEAKASADGTISAVGYAIKGMAGCGARFFYDPIYVQTQMTRAVPFPSPNPPPTYPAVSR